MSSPLLLTQDLARVIRASPDENKTITLGLKIQAYMLRSSINQMDHNTVKARRDYEEALQLKKLGYLPNVKKKKSAKDRFMDQLDVEDEGGHDFENACVL